MSFAPTPRAIPDPRRPIRKTFDYIRQRISLILRQRLDQHVDACGLLSRANIYRPSRSEDNKILSFR